MDRIVDGDVQQDIHTDRNVDAVTRDLTVNDRHAAHAGSQAQERLPPEAASHQVVVGDIPLEPPGFRPKVSLLAQLDRAGSGVAVIHAVTGLLGLGTTQLAAAYARAKLAADWRLVAWVNGTDTASLQAGLAAVADATGLVDRDSGRNIADAGRAVRHLLETDGDRCLLVFDDVADPEALRPFIPANGTAQVLITSTRQPPAHLGAGIPMDVFSADEASAFLIARTGLDDKAGAAAVAAVLGHLPLALALAAPMIAGRNLGYGWYLDQLQATSAEVSLTGDDGRPYPQGVAKAVLLFLEAVQAADQMGVLTRAVEIMAVFSAAGVRRELLYVAGRAGLLAGGGRRVAAAQVDRVLEWLRDRSLLTFSLNGKIVIVHRLVAQAARDRLDRRQRLTAVCRAAASVLEACAMALARSQDRAAIRGIPQQVTALLDNTAGLDGEADEELADTLLRLRFIALYYLIELGDSASQAIAVGESLTADLERLLGADHPDTLNSRNSLASAYLAVGRAAEAIPLFQQTLAVRQRLLGPDDPDTLTSQNNLAAAYQDDGRATEAIRLYEHTLAVRERLLGAGHPRTLTSRGNLAAALQNAGRAAEAIPLFEQVLTGRERVLGPDHPDSRTSRINLANAYRDAGRATEANPLFEQVLATRKPVLSPDHPDARTSQKNVITTYWDGGWGAKGILPVERTLAPREKQPPTEAAGQASPASLRRPPADPVRRVLPTDFRRPPADPVRRPAPDHAARPSAKPGHSSPGLPQHSPSADAPYDRDIVAAVRAGDRAGIAMAYDKYAAALYGYCHWMLHDSADAAGALRDTFVIATATLGDLAEPSELRPWLFALARNECQRRIRTTSATRDEMPAPANQQVDTDQRADAADQPIDATMPFRPIGQPIDATVSFRAVSQPIGQPIDATVSFRAVSQPTDATYEPIDATMPFRLVSQLTDATYEPIDATMPFRLVSQLTDATYEPIDATMPFRMVSQLTDATYEPIDATMPFRMVSQSANATDGPGHADGERRQAELRTLTYSILAELRPREREVIELSFRHDLYDNDLAIALGVSWSRAHALASRARSRLETALDALLIALTRREACPALGKMLADWDGQLNKRTRDLVGLHVVQCEECADHGNGALRPAAFSRLLPSAPLPPELRKQVLSRCFSTAKDAVAYRRRVAQRAESTWFGRFSETMGWTWESIRANRGAAIAALAVALWAVAAASVTLLTVAGANAHAQAVQPSVRTSASSPAAAVTTVPAAGPTSRTSPSASPSRTTRPSPTYVQLPYVPSASPTLRTEPPSPSGSPKPSKSPSPSPSHSGSPSPSSSGSPSASKTP